MDRSLEWCDVLFWWTFGNLYIGCTLFVLIGCIGGAIWSFLTGE